LKSLNKFNFIDITKWWKQRARHIKAKKNNKDKTMAKLLAAVGEVLQAKG
jgi:hypothetical protein